ncbi:hypothetical protein NDU88_007006 [Pleurodeles waltl]|uniref:ribonuclease H n=1 Tax=Pleurodeles waltl TaxID=8319 RepID=A0AAV7SRL1_PLEWA|nr:hypothetical protein NDU88_007006 [Pleurodeles waltl]
MPCGLCNVLDPFQYFVNNVLRAFLDQFLVVYIDDILVFSQNLRDHVDHVRAVLKKMLENNLYVKLEKCAFHETEVEFFRFVLSENGVSMDPAKIQTILDWPSPKTVKEVQSFIGFANFYLWFIKEFSKKVVPITKLLRKGVPFHWSTDAEDSFEFLKRAFTTALILLHPNPEEPFFVEADASDQAIGGVLSQRHKETGQLHPVAFRSRKLTSPE